MPTLRPRQVKAATLLAAGKTAREVARDVRCTPETISRWRRDACFQKLVAETQVEGILASQETLRAAAKEACAVLVELMRNARSEEVRRKSSLDVLQVAGALERGGRLDARSIEVPVPAATSHQEGVQEIVALLKSYAEEHRVQARQQPLTVQNATTAMASGGLDERQT
jgi:hypothetical protein